MPNAYLNDWVIIGISGVTCGGKTTLANKLQELLTPCSVIHQDKYFYPDDSPHHVKCETLAHNNYDILTALDMDRMYADILDVIKGEKFSFRGSSDCGVDSGKFRIANKNCLIIEGITVLNYEPIYKLCNFKYYFVLEYAECMQRRCMRLYDPPDVPGYFERCVWPEHERYRDELLARGDVTVLDGRTPDAVDRVLCDLRGHY